MRCGCNTTFHCNKTLNDLIPLSAVVLGQLLQQRQVSSVEITRQYLDRIARDNPKINCFIQVEAESALEQARQIDRRRGQGESLHPLAGIPIALKDIFERKGRRGTAGSRPFAFSGQCTATVVKRLYRVGAVLLGTLNMDEFAAGGTGLNEYYGRCLNPLDDHHLSGGSSSGSAAAVAADMAPLTLGSDAGGSIRLPAGYCGVTGLKPTYGCVSRHGVIPRTRSMDCIGPIARSAADCGLLLDAIAGRDPADSTSVDSAGRFSPLPTQNALQKITVGMDCALLEGLPQAQSDNLQLSHSALHTNGFTVAQTTLPDIDLLNDFQQVLVKCEGASFIGPKLRTAPDQISLATRSVIQEGFLIPATCYIEALSLRATLLDRFVAQAFKHCDAILMPLFPDRIPRFIPENQTDGPHIDKQFSDSARFTRFANYLGIPAIAFPTGKDESSLPTAGQLIGKPGSEILLLGLVQALQAVTED